MWPEFRINADVIRKVNKSPLHQCNISNIFGADFFSGSNKGDPKTTTKKPLKDPTTKKCIFEFLPPQSSIKQVSEKQQILSTQKLEQQGLLGFSPKTMFIPLLK